MVDHSLRPKEIRWFFRARLPALIAVAAVAFAAGFSFIDEPFKGGPDLSWKEAAYFTAPMTPDAPKKPSHLATLKSQNGGTENGPQGLSHPEKSAFLGPAPQGQQAPRPFKQAMTTLFWTGERATGENDYIANTESFWDKHWAAHYGGVDDPERRCGFHPCGFTPRENPFYVALPYGELDDSGKLKANASAIPLHLVSQGAREPSLKNHWVEIRRGNRTCYGQWEDVGPFETDDFDYVFGSAPHPKNRAGVGAGLDVSPAVWKCLGLEANATTSWRLVSEAEVPAGPWKDIITRGGGSQ